MVKSFKISFVWLAKFTEENHMALFRVLVLLVAAWQLEIYYFSRDLFSPPSPLFPLFSFFSTRDPRAIIFLESLFFALLPLAFWRRTVVPACLTAGVLLLLILSLDIGERAQFHILPVPILFAVALSEMLGRSEEHRRWQAVPVTVTIGLIYGFATFHKLFNFHSMQTFLPWSAFRLMHGRVDAICADENCFILQSLKWIVIPVEATLTFLTFSRKYLRERLIFAFLFHSLIAFLMFSLMNVSLPMLLLHFYLACLEKPESVRRVLENRNWAVLAASELCLWLTILFISPMLSVEGGALLVETCQVSLYLFPVAFLLWPFIVTPPLQSQSSFSQRYSGLRNILLSPRRPLELGLGLFIAASFAYGLSPFFYKDLYSVRCLGWQMFAVPVPHKFRTIGPAGNCFDLRKGYGNVIIKKRFGDRFLYYSWRKQDLETLWEFYLNIKHCPMDPKSAGDFEIKPIADQ
jgi:hypothetical protein